MNQPKARDPIISMEIKKGKKITSSIYMFMLASNYFVCLVDNKGAYWNTIVLNRIGSQGYLILKGLDIRTIVAVKEPTLLQLF